MTTIAPKAPAQNAVPNKAAEKSFFKDYSKVVFSRESTYRGFVDVFANDIPELAAAATRNKAYFLEELMKSITATGAIFLAPKATKLSAKIAASSILSDEERKDLDKYLLFSRTDIDDLESLEKAKPEIARKEAIDQENLAKLFGQESKKGKEHLKKAAEIKEFFKNLKITEDLKEKLHKLKKSVIIGENIIESSFWGFFPFLSRLFRKYALGIDRFTGTLDYIKDQDNDKLGNQKGFTKRQMLGTLAAMFFPPLLTILGLKITDDKEAVSKSDFLKGLKNQLDMKHGVYPKLGLFALFGAVPMLVSKVFNAQGPLELFESIIKFSITCSSLLLGDRVTNGTLAKKADKELQKEFGTSPGILYHHVDKQKGKALSASQKLSQTFPEASKFQEVLDKTNHDEKLKETALGKYTKVLYKGFSLHAAGSFLVKMLVFKLTKLKAILAIKEN